MKIHPVAMSTLLLALLAGCGMSSETSFVPAIVVEIYDARTGEPAAYGATVIARDGSYADTVKGSDFAHPGGQISVFVADDRPGTYDVTVTKPGYEIWRRENIRVREVEGDGFFAPTRPDQVQLAARLEPLSP